MRSTTLAARGAPGTLFLVLALGLGALLGAGCRDRGPSRAPDVVLVVVDTLRADHVSCYGYPTRTTPAVDALAEGADLYLRCEATAPWTVPSHGSLFTGRWPFQHGADTARLADGRIADALPLPDAQQTLAEALQAAGYRTAGFVANKVYLSPSFGFDQGFERYEAEREPAVELARRGLEWIDEGGGRPFFLFLNVMDAHRPYNVAPLPTGRAAALPAPPSEHPGELLDRLYEQVMARGEPPDPELRAGVVAQYDHGVAHADLGIELLLAGLRERGLLGNALVIVTSDHGEYFGEHGLVEHSKDVYEEALHVPLVVKRPGQERGRRVERRVSIADVPGMVLAELPQELAARAGADFPAPAEERPLFASNRFSRQKDLRAPWGARFERERAVLFAERFKLILSSDGANELYDLGADPREQRDLSAERPELFALLERRLRALLASGAAGAPVSAPVELSPADLEELRRLGYL